MLFQPVNKVVMDMSCCNWQGENMNRSFRCLRKPTIGLVLSACALVATGIAAAYSQLAAAFFDVTGKKHFSHYREALLRYLRSRGNAIHVLISGA